MIVVKRQRSGIPIRFSDSESDPGFGSSSSSQSDSDSEQPPKAPLDVESDSSDGQSEKCPICLLSFNSQEVGSPESCEHNFCVSCIHEWAKTANTCPVDRKEFRVIVVRGHLNGDIYRQIEIQPPNPFYDINIVEEPTNCEVCRLGDREDQMLLCDGCDLGYHMGCLTPPLNNVPLGAWFCPDCDPVNPLVLLEPLENGGLERFLWRDRSLSPR